jgi:ribonucleoside-diphosphate reductase alpha chain|tara:strand:- start:96 stop:1868 length:1773 start_codon:yes stop_codon:yes gene_type:complete
MTIELNLERDKLFDALGLQRLRESYMMEEEVSPQERFAYVSEKFGSNPEHAQRLYEYSSQHWLSYSTPILSFGRSKRGLPISCFLNYIEDSAEGLVDNLSETNWLSMLGGGVGIHLGIRNSDDKSTGVMPHLKMYDASSLAYRQGRTRRGSYATFLDVSHPDIIQFLEMRKPTGDQNMRTLNLNHGVNISDKFMETIERCMKDPDANDDWELINPANGVVAEVVSAKNLWQKMLDLRMQTGEPYFVFIDTANRELPEWLKDKGLRINGSNLCTEIFLPTSAERTAVCCLSSVNLEYYDEWKGNKQFIPDIMEMLDNVVEYFITNAPDHISRAVKSATAERSVGLGALGFHAYLQKNNIPIDGVMAKLTNKDIFYYIKKECERADNILVLKRGACPDAAEFGIERRFSHHMAVAPNASSSLIMGNTSPSVEPYRANVFRQDTLSGAFVYRNRFLSKRLAELGLDDDDTWASIIANDGSVQHLDVPDDIKEVFKTAMEIDQRWLVELAADRQKFIDQGQSINLFFQPNTTIAYLHAVHFMAWKMGLKSLYYLRSDKVRKADKVGAQIRRQRIEETIDMTAIANGETCLACEG